MQLSYSLQNKNIMKNNNKRKYKTETSTLETKAIFPLSIDGCFKGESSSG